MPNLLAITPNFTVDIVLSIPVLRPGEVHRTTHVEKIPGGKGVNVARVVRQLNHQAEIAGFLGGDVGRYAERYYANDGFTGIYVWYDGETRECVLASEADGRTTVINEAGAPLSDEIVAQLAQRVGEVSNQYDWMSMSGSIPPGAPPKAYEPLISAMRPAKLALDSHGASLEVFAHQKADLLRINNNEASDLLGFPVKSLADAQTACIELHAWGNKRVAISLGAPGAVGYDGDDIIHATTPPVQVISPVGAGDSMMAGMLAALMDGKSFADALRYGVASGAACCTVQRPGFLPLDTFQALFNASEIKVLL
jgi:1-phosphofructokinase